MTRTGFEVPVIFLLIVAAGVAVRLFQKTWSSSSVDGASADFRAFQQRYLAVYWLCAFTDWLKGPYVYALYEQYGFDTYQITLLFIGGFLSSLFFGTVVGSWSDRRGRKFMCLVFCGVYAMSALTKPINSFPVLMLGRVLSGIATSLLFTAFEAWMVSEHRNRGFPEGLLTNTFSKATLGNGVVAILAGLVAQLSASCCGFTAPFLVAVPCLAVAALLITPWKENYGNADSRPFESIKDGLDLIARESGIFALGACESIFEACIYVWVFYWTPAISTRTVKGSEHETPLGFLFSGYMAAFMVGGAIPGFVHCVPRLAIPMHATATLSFALSAIFFENKLFLFCSFALFEGCVGMYFPTHGTLRSIHLPEATRASVMNLFRLPMNLFVVGALQLQIAPFGIMLLLCAAQLVALLTYVRFDTFVTRNSTAKAAA